MFNLRLMQIIYWFVFYFDYAYLIRLCDVIKPTIWPPPLQFICKYWNAHNFHIFQPILMIRVSKSMVYSAPSFKTYLSPGLRSPLIITTPPIELFLYKNLFACVNTHLAIIRMYETDKKDKEIT